MKSFLARYIFLIDGLGALTTALMLGFVLPTLEVGMSKALLLTLSLTAVAFALYSLCCFLTRRQVGVWLKIIVAANGLYCAVTASVVGYLYAQLTPLGVIYFVGEVLVILLLVRFEFSLLNQSDA